MTMIEFVEPISFGGRLCGHYYPERKMYISERTAKIHYYKKGAGYPITNEILKNLKSRGCEHIIIKEIRAVGFKMWHAPLQKYLDAVMITEGDFEPQRCVPLKEMTDVTKS